MPSLEQLEAAVPKCPRLERRMIRGELAPEERCAQPCRYIAARNVWQCPNPRHGDVWAGEVLGAILNGDLELEGLNPTALDQARLHAA